MRIQTLTIAISLTAFMQISAPANATYTVTVERVGNNVVETGSGSLDLTDLTLGGTVTDEPPRISGNFGEIFLGAGAPSTAVDYYRGYSGPFHFGTGPVFYADIGAGNIVGLAADAGTMFVPHGYVSGTALGTSTATWNNATTDSLGLAAGSYVWTWGVGAHADSFELQIIPEPDTLALLGLTGLGAGVMAYRRRM